MKVIHEIYDNEEESLFHYLYTNHVYRQGSNDLGSAMLATDATAEILIKLIDALGNLGILTGDEIVHEIIGFVNDPGFIIVPD